MNLCEGQIGMLKVCLFGAPPMGKPFEHNFDDFDLSTLDPGNTGFIDMHVNYRHR